MRMRSQTKGVVARALALVIFFSCLGAGDILGQEWRLAALRFEASREVLEEALSRFDNAARSQAYSSELRARARAEAAGIRNRLQEGDFRVGDQILLAVEGDSVLSDTFVVALGLIVQLPNVGEISLGGVLRSELQSHITQELDRFLADPVIRARPMIPIAILGAVNEPGYYRVPIETPITDAIMLVGGPTDRANLRKAHLDRYGERIWLGPELETALREGETLDEIKMLPGDEVIIPTKPALSFTQIVGLVGTVAGTVFALNKIFN